MKPSLLKGGLLLVGVTALTLAGCATNPSGPESGAKNTGKAYVTREVTDGTTTFTVVENPNDGKTLSMSATSTFELIEVEEDGFTYAFKDMNGDGKLDKWEDWRLSPEERAQDLAPQLTTEQVAGLMLFSPSEYAVADGLTDVQRTYLTDDKLRLILSAGTNNVKDNVTWSNEVQALVESLATSELPYVPVNFSTDPRSDATGGYSGSATDEISQWPGNLGLAATFDPEIVREFGQIASREYRALGITNALSPQIDVASDPRWMRNNGTFGEDSELSAKLTAAFVDGFQNTFDEDGNSLGWGDESVSTVIKHFAGDAAGEGGRASYNDSGKYSVFPGDNFDDHLIPFMSGMESGGMMTAYSIPVDGKGKALIGEPVGAAFNKELVDIFRVDKGYEGVIMTDWGVTAGGAADPDAEWFTNWGVEDLTVEERHFLVLKAGIDMFGGNSDAAPVMAAHQMWQEAFEKGDLDVDADARFAQSAARILKLVFASGLYDNPYLELEKSEEIVGSADKKEAGFEAQKNSVVVLKNDNNAIGCKETVNWKDKTVYIPRTYDIGTDDLFKDGSYSEGPSVSTEVAEQYFKKVVTDEVKLDADGRVVSYTAPDMKDVDAILVGLSSPNNGYNFAPTAGIDTETGEYRPISLQYHPYTADSDAVRKVSISGNILPDGSKENRSYFGKTSRVTNEADILAFERAVKAADDAGKDIPVLTMLSAKNPIIPTEFEPQSDVIAVGFDISEAALLEVLLGMHEGSGRLPIAFPATMEAVEGSAEDVSGDVTPYVDSAGNEYTFGFGLSCTEPIK